MNTSTRKCGGVGAGGLASRGVVATGLGLLIGTLAVSGQERAAAVPPQSAQPAMGSPVNIYARNADPYAPPAPDGQIHPWHVNGQVWLMAGEPDQSNVAVHLGDQGVFVIDTGTTTMAPALLTQI